MKVLAVIGSVALTGLLVSACWFGGFPMLIYFVVGVTVGASLAELREAHKCRTKRS